MGGGGGRASGFGGIGVLCGLVAEGLSRAEVGCGKAGRGRR